jgi:hypothetical protein
MPRMKRPSESDWIAVGRRMQVARLAWGSARGGCRCVGGLLYVSQRLPALETGKRLPSQTIGYTRYFL